MKLINLFGLFGICVLSLGLVVGAEDAYQSDEYADGYYEDSYEETVEVGSAGEAAPPKPTFFHGFHRHGGASVVKIAKVLATETYINQTVEIYDCVKKVHANILAVEKNEEEEEDDYLDAFDQVLELRKQMDQLTNMVSSIGNGSVAEQNATANATATAAAKKAKKKTFREKQEEKMREKREKEAEKEQLRPKFRMGADCESLVCGSCKVIVEEFGRSVHAVVNSSEHQYIEDVTVGFCKSKGIALKHNDMVGDICMNFEEETLGYKEALMEAYEATNNWNEVASWSSLNANKKKVCTAVGACEKESFVFQTKPLTTIQEHWDDKCLVCQAFAFDLEVKVHLSRSVTEGNIVHIVKETCDRLDLEPYYYKQCQPLTEGKLLDDISWLTKVHGESIEKKAKGEQRFPDKLCEEIDWCKPWVDPVKLREKEAQMSMEQVFF